MLKHSYASRFYLVPIVVLCLTSVASADLGPAAPLLDLVSGGQAAGAAQGSGPTAGRLVNGSLLPSTGPGFSSVSEPATSWGAGMMVSFIVNASPLLAQQFPGTTLYIGDIAQRFGGPYPPHKSHQNGLDADMLFVGMKTYDSVLDASGRVSSRFDLEKNWWLWRLVVSQQIMFKGRLQTAVSMILVHPAIKTYLCAKAKARQSTLDTLDLEVLRRLRPTEGHDNHFHLRLRCSPYYTECISGGDGFSKTGCPEIDGAE